MRTFVARVLDAGAMPLAPGEEALLRQLFSEGDMIELDNSNHELLGKAKQLHRASLQRDYKDRYFRVNGAKNLPAILIAIAISIIALNVGSGASFSVIAPPSSSAIRCGIWGRSYRSRHSHSSHRGASRPRTRAPCPFPPPTAPAPEKDGQVGRRPVGAKPAHEHTGRPGRARRHRGNPGGGRAVLVGKEESQK